MWEAPPLSHVALRTHQSGWVPVWPHTGNNAIARANAETLLAEGPFWIDARLSQTVNGHVTNLGTAGSALDARYGSTAGADTNDPLFLPHDGVNYFYVPTANHNRCEVPDSPDWEATVNIDVRVAVAADSWANGANQDPIGHDFGSGGTDRSWYLRITAGGAVTVALQGSGGSGFYTTPTALPAGVFTPGSLRCLRFTYVVSSGAVQVLYKTTTESTAAADLTSNSGWTVHGTGNISAGALTNNPALPLRFPFAPNAVIGKFYAVSVTTDGVQRFLFDSAADITSPSATSFTATSGQTVSVLRHTSGCKSTLVTRPIWLFGTDDYFEVPNHADLNFGAGQQFTVIAVRRGWATAGTTAVIAKRASLSTPSDPGWQLQRNVSGSDLKLRTQVSDGTTNATADSTAETLGNLSVHVVTRDSGGVIRSRRNGEPTGSTTATLSGSLTNSEVMRIGRLSGAGTSYADMELVAAAVIRRALTNDEIADIAHYYSLWG
jgi:hypothetical protein